MLNIQRACHKDSEVYHTPLLWRCSEAGSASLSGLAEHRIVGRANAVQETPAMPRVAGGEAVQFFTRTGLPKTDLSKVWRAAKWAAPADGEGLTIQQFAAAMRVVAYAQVRVDSAASADYSFCRLQQKFVH